MNQSALHRSLPWLTFFFALFCWVLHPHGALRTGYLADSDDYMRLNETINWLQGQGWFDLSHPRLSPGTGTIVHWSRLLDVPLALLMLPFIKLIGMQNAALLASFIVPPATFALLLGLVVRLAKVFAGPEAGFAAPLLLFAPLTLMNFAPGRVDHHGYEILVAGFGLYALDRMVADKKRGYHFAIYAAIVFALGLWIGTEALPWVLLFIACLGTMAAWRGGVLPRRAALFGVAFAVSTALALPLAVAPADYASLALSWFSSADVLLAVLVAIVFGLSALLGKYTQQSWLRFLVMTLLGLAAAFVFYRLVPNLTDGPFTDYDDFNSGMALASIGEAQPLINKLHFNYHSLPQIGAAALGFLQYLFLPLTALAANVFALRRAAKEKRPLLISYAVYLTVSILLTVFWQVRVGWFMQFFAIPPLAYVLVRSWHHISMNYYDRARFGMEILVFALLGFIPVVLIPAMAHDAPFFSDVILFPAARPAPACPMRPTADFLNAPYGYGKATHTIMASANNGPELLFRTRHNVIAANFNVTGNEDTYNFFGARDDKTAQNILKRWHADLVLVCHDIPLAYARLDHAHIGSTAFLSPDKDGKLRLVSNPQHLTLIEKLVRGENPKWLKPVEISGNNDYLLFEARFEGK